MTNRLASESSPYLLQHADNPVDWYPWGEKALQQARDENKPILLSIGYSTCHWCHVMARESFADPAIAAVMNQHFINIKVDREERPDLDKIYQTALQLLTQQGGGWPLTMFLDPQTHLPFFGGTYFPNTPRYQLPGFSDLLLRLAEVFTSQHTELAEQGEKLKATLGQMITPLLAPQVEDVTLLGHARDLLSKQYDPQEGGFGNAPKFPMTSTLRFVLRHWSYDRRGGGSDKQALDMVMITLTQMARGGIFDHLGGGFCRYSTDRKWMIPHFEKMLYDNAQLLSMYSEALAIGPDELFEAAVRDTIAWLHREMRDPQGGFYAAIDADSEGEEGRFYVWRREQIKKALTEDEYLVVETLYGLDKPANFDNRWNLHRYDSWRSVVSRLSLSHEDADALLRSAREKLFSLREDRVHPATDTKLLTAWNALLIKGMADAGRQLNETAWVESAAQAVDFLAAQCWDGTQLYATWHKGEARHPGYLDDYANLLEGLLHLLQARWREQDFVLAQALAERLLSHFYDEEIGGFFFTAHEHEILIHRPKPTMDDALPPGNGTAALGLLRLGELLGEPRYVEAGHKTLAWARALMEKVPAGHSTLLTALEETVHPPELVILRGPVSEFDTWRIELNSGYTPWRAVYAIPYDGVTTVPSYLPRLVSAEQQGQVTAYVCSGLQCSLPIQDLDELKDALS